MPNITANTVILKDGTRVRLTAGEVTAIRKMMAANGVDGVQWLPAGVARKTHFALFVKGVLVPGGDTFVYRFAEGLTFPAGIEATPKARPANWTDVLKLAETADELPPVKLTKRYDEFYSWSNKRDVESPGYVSVNVVQARDADGHRTKEWELKFFVGRSHELAFTCDSRVRNLATVRQVLARVARAFDPEDGVRYHVAASMCEQIARRAAHGAAEWHHNKVVMRILGNTLPEPAERLPCPKGCGLCLWTDDRWYCTQCHWTAETPELDAKEA